MGKFEQYGQVGKNSRYGDGYSQPQPPQGTALGLTPITYADFRGGFDARTLREGVPANSTNNCLDFELTPEGRLKVMEGVQTIEAMAHTPTKIITQVSLSGTSELVIFSPPFIGVKQAGSTVWTNIALSSKKLTRHTIYGDQLIFYGGGGDPFIRSPNTTPIAATGIPKANAYGVFANRVYAGGLAIDGQYQPMGIGWSALSGDPTDFEGEGANFETLIDETISGDEILALKTLGLNLMAILCKHSIWIARFQGIDERPADLQSREVGHGVFAPETAKSSPIGVIYLARDGVRVFDSNSSRLISERINSEILPLGTDPDTYRATYDPARSRYLLHTPTETWVYYVSDDRWLPYSLVSKGGAFFATQVAATKWSDLTGRTWEDLVGTTWQDLEGRETDPSVLYFINDTSLGKQDAGVSVVFSNNMTPRWEVPRSRGFLLHNLVETQGFEIEYKGSAMLNASMPDIAGNMEFVLAKQLNRPELNTKFCPCVHTGLTSGLLIEVSNFIGLEISQLQLVTQTEGPTYHATEEDLPPGATFGGLTMTLPMLTWAASGSVPVSVAIIDTYSYMNLLSPDQYATDQYAYMNPTNYARIIEQPYMGYTDRGDIPANNADGIHRAYGVLYNGLGAPTPTTLMGHTFRFAALGPISEIGCSFILNLNNKTLTTKMQLAKFFSSMTQFPIFASATAREMSIEITTDRRVQFARYDAFNASTPALVIGPSATQLPATGFVRLDFRLLADNVNGAIKMARVDTTPAQTLLDASGFASTKNPQLGPFTYPICYGGITIDPDRTNTVSDGIMFHGVVFYGTAGLGSGQLLGNVACGTLIPTSNGDTITSDSGGGFFGYPTLADRWKNLLYGTNEGYVESPIPHGDEGNAQVNFLNGQKDLYHVGTVNPAATQILAVMPNFYAGRGGSSASPNVARLVLKSGGVTLNGPNINIKHGGGGWQGGIATPEGAFTALPKWVILNDPATGVPFTPTGLGNAQFGWEVLTTQPGTTNFLSLLSVEYLWR